MPRLHSIMRALAYITLAALSIHLIYSLAINLKSNGNDESTGNSDVTLAAELCQYLELKDTGSEGETEDGKYTLRGVTMLFRHGERSPIVKDDLSSHHDCAPFRDSDRQNFLHLKKIMDSREFAEFIKRDKEFDQYPFYPLAAECSPGNLTAEGTLQLSRLGNHVRKAYEKRGFLKEEGNNLDVKVTVSPFRRTFQSSIAFLSSFLFPLKGKGIDKVHVAYSNETFHCTDSFCTCPPAFGWRAQFEKEHLAYYLADDSGLREKTQRVFSQIKESKASKDPFNMMDVILGRFMCRRHSLPCTRSGECVSENLIKEMLDFTTRRGVAMFNGGNEFISARLHTAEGQAILGYVAAMGDELRENKERNSIRIFSGHDTTIVPLLRTLRIPFVDFPRYASHVVFEIYHDKEGADFIRLIYNGIDRTAELPFCGGKDMCPMTTFSRFVRSGIFAALGFSNVTQLCDPSLTPQPQNAY